VFGAKPSNHKERNMNPISPIWQERRAIGWFDVDVLGRLRPQTLFAYFLDAASGHAEGTSYAFEPLSARNLKWVMVKLQLVIRQQPRRGDQITVETWGKRIERFYALRDFAMHSASGEKMVSGTSAWLIVDNRRGLPQRWGAESEALPWQQERDELVTRLEKVPELENGRQVATYRVHFSDIDVNRHVNASRYLQWIVDAHSEEHLEACELAAVDLSFLAEALPGDEVAVFSEDRGESELCSARRASDGKELCRAELWWRSEA
jgi:medium-chain acyl-[acyl-carrier-protein] hydrolase